jgi:soluble lytic murein transglycosylase-like protein
VESAGAYPYEDLIVSAAESYGVDPALIRAVVQVESGFDPGLVSSAGAMGLMQLMPETAEALGVPDALDPAQNIDGGIRCLLGQIIRFDGDVRTALAAYNCGPNGLRSRGVTDAGDPVQAARLPTETQNYLKKVEAALTAMGRGELLSANFFA